MDATTDLEAVQRALEHHLDVADLTSQRDAIREAAAALSLEKAERRRLRRRQEHQEDEDEDEENEPPTGTYAGLMFVRGCVGACGRRASVDRSA